MKDFLEATIKQFEENKDIVLDSPVTLVEIDQLKALGGNFQSILTTMFMPFLRKMLEFNILCMSSDFDTFKRRLKINTNLLDPIEPLLTFGARFVLAGGKMIDFCNNLTIAESRGDYDLFFFNEDDFLIAAVILKRAGYEVLSEKQHVVEMFDTSRGIKVQLVKTLFSCPEEVISSFDIRACAVAFADSRVYWSKGCLKDIRDKKVVIQNLRPYKLAWVRPLKYYSKGYTIAPPDLALISYSYLMSMDHTKGHDTLEFFTDREYRYSSALEASLYDVFTEQVI